MKHLMSQSKKQPKAKKQNKEATSRAMKIQEKEVMRQRELVKSVLFPFLMENTKSIVEAKRLCYEVQQILTQSFQKEVAAEQKRLSELTTDAFEFKDVINKGAGFKVDKALVSLFTGEKLSVTNALLGGMSAALDSFINEEMSSRKLDTLKTTFL